MRPGQQNKRLRGRNRKGPNPMARVLESNGPDVKIRGTAAHIAEKYVSLARDAQASGDPVAAENYLQHAEHYFRMIAAAQAQMPQHQQLFREETSRDDDFESEEEYLVNGAPVPGLGPQPIMAPQSRDREGGRDGYQYREGYHHREPREHRDGYGSREAQGSPHGSGGPAMNGAAGDMHPPEPGSENGPVAEAGEREPMQPRRRRRGRRRPVGDLNDSAGGSADANGPEPGARDVLTPEDA